MANKADLYIKVDEYGYVTVNPPNGNEYDYAPENYAQLTGAKTEQHGIYEIENEGWLNIHSDYSDPREGERAFSKGPQSGSNAQNMRMVDCIWTCCLRNIPMPTSSTLRLKSFK